MLQRFFLSFWLMKKKRISVSMCFLCPGGEGKGESPGQSKQPRYQLGRGQRGAIKADSSNKKMWGDLLGTIRTVSHHISSILTLFSHPLIFNPVLTGLQAGFLSRVQDAFSCIVCQELVYQPITTSCGHNICKVTTEVVSVLHKHHPFYFQVKLIYKTT